MSPTKDVQFYSGSLMNQHSQVYDPLDVILFLVVDHHEQLCQVPFLLSQTLLKEGAN